MKSAVAALMGLTAIDPDLHVVPALANSWTVSDDGRTYRFELRPSATFHNGRALTPADIVASIARIRDPKTGSPYASRFAAVTAVATQLARALSSSASGSPTPTSPSTVIPPIGSKATPPSPA